jgi:hypothetical protein
MSDNPGDPSKPDWRANLRAPLKKRHCLLFTAILMSAGCVLLLWRGFGAFPLPSAQSRFSVTRNNPPVLDNMARQEQHIVRDVPESGMPQVTKKALVDNGWDRVAAEEVLRLHGHATQYHGHGVRCIQQHRLELRGYGAVFQHRQRRGPAGRAGNVSCRFGNLQRHVDDAGFADHHGHRQRHTECACYHKRHERRLPHPRSRRHRFVVRLRTSPTQGWTSHFGPRTLNPRACTRRLGNNFQ